MPDFCVVEYRRMKKTWLLAAFILSVTIALLHQWATADFWYWRYPWFDIVMHFLGGLTIGVFLIRLFADYKPMAFLTAFVAIAIGWEIFEFAIGAPRDSTYAADTVIDLCMDVLGGTLAYFAARLTLWRSV
jgi:hypothetical protein